MNRTNKIRLALVMLAVAMLCFACTSAAHQTPLATPTVSTHRLAQTVARCASVFTSASPRTRPVIQTLADRRVLGALSYQGNRVIFAACLGDVVGTTRARQIKTCLDNTYLNAGALNTDQGRGGVIAAAYDCLTKPA